VVLANLNSKYEEEKRQVSWNGFPVSEYG
jgi:hypothetical protein